jgi:5-methylcytosine-specific restriction protein A
MPRKIRYLRPNNNPSKTIRTLQPQDEQTRREFYHSKRWLRLRRVFLDANPYCAYCFKKGLITEATVAHHDKEMLDYPDLALDESNLIASCASCHSSLHKGKAGPGG